MLIPELHWITAIAPHRLALMARPRGGEWLSEEISGLKFAGITTLVSLLQASEIRELELGEEKSLCESHQISFLHLPIRDRSVPSATKDVRQLLDKILPTLKNSGGVAIHCRAGIGRTGLIAACVLNELGFTPEVGFAMLSQSRGVTVPDTPEQVNWVKNFASHTKR